MKEPSIEAQQKLNNISEDNPFIVQLGKNTYKCNYLRSGVADKITTILLKAKAIDDKAGVTQLMSAMRENSKLAPKVVSLMILGTYFKVKFFHAIFWRYLYWKYSSKDFSFVLKTLIESLSLDFFLSNTYLMSQMITTKQKRLIRNVEQSVRQAQSESKQPSAKSSE